MKTCLFFILSFRGVKKQQPIKKIKKIKNTELVEKTEENDLKTIVLEPARSKARVPGFNWVTRSPGSIFFKKNQNHVVLVKKQKSTGCNQIFDRVLPGHTGFFLLLFFFQPNPVSASGRPAGPGWILKLC